MHPDGDDGPILDAALELFGEVGIPRTTIGDVAKRAKINRVTVYRRIGSKDELVRAVIDRTFVDEEGTRWVVDYKTGLHEGGDVEAFLDAERERYRPQLERYAALLRRLDGRPLKMGLYFPLLGGWREWS